MSKKKLFDEDSDEEVSFRTENEYAKKYDSWREKEEIHKLEQKYGPKALHSDASLSTDSEDESDELPEVSEEVEKQFLKTLALLKTKDPRIYDSNYKFFEDEKEKKLVKEEKPKTLTFADSDEDDDDGGDIFTIEKKADIQLERDKKSDETKDEKLKDFLTGKVEHIDDDDVEKDLEPLKALWSDPKLSESEAFLRDYILNKRYLDEGDAGDAVDKLRDDEDLEADEKLVEEQGKFERAYNFRFEEPDEEYLKRFPRTMNYIRPKDDRRARKRAEVRARKDEEKRKKMEEIARLKALKLKEIQEKIAKIKEVTGNEDLAFKEEDIEGDFDPEEHDRRMRALFDEQYYGDVDEQKPVFPDLDEELEIENWENYEPEHEQDASARDDGGPHCEDDDFNMDADYDPKQARANLLEEIQKNLGKKRRNRKKKSKLGQLLSTEKPKYVPTVAEKTYDEYMEEYYKMDCEDVIGGDLPTRFKYREVVPNDYGLTVEEILLADDKELTQWVPLKRIVKHRPENVEKGEVKMYAKRAGDERLKRKVLPSLFKDLPEEPEIVVPMENIAKKKKKKKNKDKLQANESIVESNQHKDSKEIHYLSSTEVNSTNEKKNKKKHKKDKSLQNDSELVNYLPDTEDITINKKKKHIKNKITNETINNVSNIEVNSINKEKKKKKHKKDKKGSQDGENGENFVDSNEKQELKHSHDLMQSDEVNKISKRKKKKNKQGEFTVEDLNEIHTCEKGNLDKNSLETIQTVNRNKINLEEEIVKKDTSKRKINSNIDIHIPKKKKQKTETMNSDCVTNNKSSNKKIKQKDKFIKKQNIDSPRNPLCNLSDERLRAYGLNPKKYRSFLKYKKF